MKNKIFIILAATVFGVTLGYFLFGTSSDDGAQDHSDHSTAEQIWTCSMHPQIRKPEPGDCPICGMDLILADAASNGNPLVFTMTEDAMRIANVETTVIGVGSSHEGGLVLSGKIEPDETVASSIVSHISGRIEKLYVSFTGDYVHQGQKIASIYSPDLITAQNELLAAQKLKNENPQLLEAAKNKLRYWKITNKEINEIIKSGRVKEHFDIRADYSGVIQVKKVSVGDYLSRGGVLFELQNLNQLWAVFDVYEAQLKEINIGSEVTFTTPSLMNEEFVGKVSFIDPFIDPTTRTAAVRLKIINSQNKLKPEMFITGQLKHEPMHKYSVLTVPKTAVLWTGERSVVYVKLPDLEVPSFEYREVEIGATVGMDYELIEGLIEGDEVVTNGALVIDASAQLNNQVSMMNRSLLETTTAVLPTSPDFTEATPDKFKEQLEMLLSLYYVVKDGFVNDDLKLAIRESAHLLETLTTIDMSMIQGNAHMFWMEKMKSVKTAITQLTETTDITDARIIFGALSRNMIEISKAFGLEKLTTFVQYCPMAFDNKGAYWLSDTDKIRNPFFGSQMLKCGSIEDKIN